MAFPLVLLYQMVLMKQEDLLEHPLVVQLDYQVVQEA